MAPADTTAPKIDPWAEAIGLDEDHPRVEDVGYPDAVDEAVGRTGYFSNWTEEECLLASDSDETAEFDRYYFPTDGQEPVLVDTLPGGLPDEVHSQEAEKRVEFKRKWCEARGVKYLVHVDPAGPGASPS